MKRPLTKDGLESLYLFIAEFNGFKKGTVQDKIDMGRACYYRETTPKLNVKDENDRKEYYEVIWLNRIYAKLDEYFGNNYAVELYKKFYQSGKLSLLEARRHIEKRPNTEMHWDIPLEIDMSASVLGYVGVLTGHAPFMERTNMLGDELVDAWEIKGIPNRTQAKVIMQTIYGSSKACQDLWKDNDIKYKAEDIIAYNEALTHGEIAVGDRFSKFIISNCNPAETMTLHVWDEKFEVECNRYRNIGEKTINYDIYDSDSGLYRRIQHTETRKVADLDQFRRFMVTGLIHNLDSQVMNRVASKLYDISGWAIDIHDALILHPNDAKLARQLYAKELEEIYENRDEILQNYFRSIGIPASAMKEWKERVVPTVIPYEGKFTCNPMVLK